ncbi:hypothetical protein DSO57_1030561 [Entomophthora muscae]|uniref:Uncharacterized protein n=1 Tax=Entomophthora muscae TaxID=34485 RepID=A0ACC2TC15_9FUNG|nr:hypothetical protein DSO57_1030561 [Entomophthora muscae]
MKFLWGLVCVSALRMPVGDLLFEKQKILDKFRFPRNSWNQGVRPEMPRKLGRLKKIVSPGGKFVFDLESYESPLLVHELEVSLQIASGFIENALVFNTPIKVQANQGNTCVRQGVCRKVRSSVRGGSYLISYY